MKSRQTGHTQEISAAKSGISSRSGRRIEQAIKLRGCVDFPTIEKWTPIFGQVP
ncbi:MAG: hypothetical protein H6937_00725 [Burkholderiales bacterium]|nr:hypothetical protein [Burkholderiales bacterium]MDR4518353.1 hypothetical protein [Nitrosomonas sp.]